MPSEEHADAILRMIATGAVILCHGALALVGVAIVFELVTGSWAGQTATLNESIATLIGTLFSVVVSGWLGTYSIDWVQGQL